MYKVIYDKYVKSGKTVRAVAHTIECECFDSACSVASKCRGAVYAPNGLRLLKYN
jgi:hypothetical protein